MSIPSVSVLTFLCLILGLHLGCSEKAVVRLKTLPSAKIGEMSPNMPSVHEFQASVSDEDLKRLQGFFQSLLPRLEALESALLWLPYGTSTLIGGSNVLIDETRVLIENSTRLVEKTDILIEKSEKMEREARRTREDIGSLAKLLAPRGLINQ